MLNYNVAGNSKREGFKINMIGQFAAKLPNGRRFNDHYVGSEWNRSASPLRGEDMIWTSGKPGAAYGIIKRIQIEDPTMIPDVLIERFYEKFEKDSETGCWNWTASTAGKGYGQIKIPKTRKQMYAHRLSYIINSGEIPDGMEVCHTCDNMRCVNPDHLFLGTQSDNLGDMKAKGRHLYGERNTEAKLTEKQVEGIHEMSAEGSSTYALARAFGVSQSTIWRILNGLRWEHVYRRRQSNELS